MISVYKPRSDDIDLSGVTEIKMSFPGYGLIGRTADKKETVDKKTETKVDTQNETVDKKTAPKVDTQNETVDNKKGQSHSYRSNVRWYVNVPHRPVRPFDIPVPALQVNKPRGKPVPKV